jgi:hypothetical protein
VVLMLSLLALAGGGALVAFTAYRTGETVAGGVRPRPPGEPATEQEELVRRVLERDAGPGDRLVIDRWGPDATHAELAAVARGSGSFATLSPAPAGGDEWTVVRVEYHGNFRKMREGARRPGGAEILVVRERQDRVGLFLVRGERVVPVGTGTDKEIPRTWKREIGKHLGKVFLAID